jgi:hypothetical protein
MHNLAQADGSSSSIRATSTPASAASQATSTPRATSGAATTTKPSPRASSSATSAPAIINQVVAETPSASQHTFFPTLIGGALVLIAIGAAALLFKNKSKEDKNDEAKCDDIKSLLEVKKKELEEMLKSWPKDKLAGIAKEGSLKVVGKNEPLRKAVNVSLAMKERYDKLNEDIEMLQKRYDLCLLSLPTLDKAVFTGTIVENILKDKKVLNKIQILKTKKVGAWTLHNISADKKALEELASAITPGAWYMHFWQEGNDNGLVIFKDKIFPINYKNKATWDGAIAHGKAIGVPEQELDFKIG